MSEIKPLSGLTKSVIIMLCIYMFVLACNLLTNIYELIEYAGYDAEAVPEEFLISQVLSGLVAIAFLVVYLITAVFFLKWVYRANKNLQILGDGRMEFSASAAVVWYFVPIACLFKPYQAMRDIWKKAHKTWNADSRLLPGWWALWIVAMIFGQIIARQNSVTIGDYRLTAITTLVSHLINIALGFTAIALISNISRAYEVNYCGAEGAETDLLEALKVTSRPSDVLENLHGANNKRD
ncbi:DUF4328 domain-containing protein [Pontiellaceae bacterium B12227]|nr:DUF4328 domain-containing protein [Pontiellaceae bacterium B12227]